jgi:cytochrome c556
MRTMIIALALATVASSALADDEVEEAHRQALQGRDTYWNCLAR